MKQEKYAFSLAEALITLLIVCLITLASIPVLTKKKRTLNTTHGSWICTIDENDQHVIYSSTTNAWTPSGQINKCTFVPPINARNFEVTIVGGGGGGASGYTERNKKIYRSNSNGHALTDYFTAQADGQYEFIVIGGGGQGGDRKNDKDRCKENPGGPGGSGGFNHGFLNLVKGRTYTIVAGAGGTGGNYGGDVGDTSSVKDGSTVLLSATGGGGGGGRWGSACGKKSGDANDGCGNNGRRGDAGSPNGQMGIIIMEGNNCSSNKKYSYPGYLCKTEVTGMANSLTVYQNALKSKSIGDLSCADLYTKYFGDAAFQTVTLKQTWDSRLYDRKYLVLSYGQGGKGRDSDGVVATDSVVNPNEGYLTDADGNLILDENGNKQVDPDYDAGDEATPSDPPVNPGTGRTDGLAGIVLLRYNMLFSGGAGKAAQPVRPAVVPSMKKLEATIGRGGTGAVNLNSNGGRGGSSYVTIYASDRTTPYTAAGGSGGVSQWKTTASASETGILSGQIGETSLVKLLKSNATGGIPGYYNNDGGKSPDGQAMPYKDRNYFGAGGGGGGAKGSSGAASEEIWGKGGKGAPGAVIIEW